MEKDNYIEIKMLVTSDLSLEDFNMKFIEFVESYNGLCTGTMKEFNE